MIDVSLTPDWLAMVAGVVLSLLFSYVPGLSTKFQSLDPTYKRLIMLALLLVVAVGVFGLSCAGVISGVLCDRNGVVAVVEAFVLAAMANQAMYQLSPKNK